jgi:hypothetical protein
MRQNTAEGSGEGEPRPEESEGQSVDAEGVNLMHNGNNLCVRTPRQY